MDQARLLLDEADAYRRGGAYTFDHEYEPFGEGWRYRCHAIEKEPPPRHWPLIAGDAIQNMRAALDHAVWAAWKTENEGDGRHTQLVIVDSADGYQVTDWDHATGKLLGSGRTQISSFIARPEGEVEQRHVEPMFEYEVRLERLPVDTLRGIAHDVFRAVTECETGERPSPFAEYPL